MARKSMSRGPQRASARHYPRTARLNEVLREVLADELERIGDDRLGLLTITGVSVDRDLAQATVWVSALTVDGGLDAVSTVLAEHRVALQAAVARQLRVKRTPLLQFRSDPAITEGQRIESILRDLNLDTAAEQGEAAPPASDPDAEPDPELGWRQ